MREHLVANIKVVRHIEELNDLRGGRDNGLKPEKKEEATKIFGDITREAKEQSKNVILFITSGKKRTQETTDLVRDLIRRNTDLKTITKTDDRLDELYQGKFRLPSDYEADTFVPELEEAYLVFLKESFGNKNYLYKFGDPVKENEESFKYPNLNKFFKEPGENYTEFSLRLYKAVIHMYENKEDLKKVLLVIVTHGYPIAVFKQLESLANDMVSNQLEIETGELMELCWQGSQKNITDEMIPDHGKVETMPLHFLENDFLLGVLKNEVSYLERKLKNHSDSDKVF